MTRNHLDAYFTPPELTRAHLFHLANRPSLPRDNRPPRVLEPCAGDGWIADELRAAGYEVITGDVDPKYGTDHVVDFLSDEAVGLYQELKIDMIITNPPWSRSAEFVRQALKITPWVSMLLRMTFLEPCEGTRRSYRLDLLDELAHVQILPRTRFIHGKKGTDTVPPAWFIWELRENMTATMESLSKKQVQNLNDLFIRHYMSDEAV